MQVAMNQGDANRKALTIAYTGTTGKAFMRLDCFNRIVEIAPIPDDNGNWKLIATRQNGLRVER